MYLTCDYQQVVGLTRVTTTCPTVARPGYWPDDDAERDPTSTAHSTLQAYNTTLSHYSETSDPASCPLGTTDVARVQGVPLPRAYVAATAPCSSVHKHLACHNLHEFLLCGGHGLFLVQVPL